MQIPSHGQWWSYCSTQTLQSLQWEVLGGRKMRPNYSLQHLQYFKLNMVPFIGYCKYGLDNAISLDGSLSETVEYVSALIGPLANGGVCLGIKPGSLVRSFRWKKTVSMKNKVLIRIKLEFIWSWEHSETKKKHWLNKIMKSRVRGRFLESGIIMRPWHKNVWKPGQNR